MPDASDSADGEAENAWNNGPSNPDGDNETAEAEVVHHNPALTPEVEALSTFSEQEGPLSFRIIPIVENSQTAWVLNVYLRGTQGPVYQNRDGLTDEAREQFGVSTQLQERINSALSYARETLEVPPSLGNKTRAKRTLHELEVMMEDQG